MPRQNGLASGSCLLSPPAPGRESAAPPADEPAAPHSSQRSHLRARGREPDGRSKTGDGGEAPAGVGVRRGKGAGGGAPGEQRGTRAGGGRPAAGRAWLG